MKINNFASRAFIRWYLHWRSWRDFRRNQRNERRRRQIDAVNAFRHRRDAMKALGLGAFLAAAAASPALATDLVFTSYSFQGRAGGTTTPASRTMPQRIGDVYNVMEFGAVGTGSPDQLSSRYGSLGAAQAIYPFVTSLTQTIDFAAIQLAINTMWASPQGSGTVFFPPGTYVTSNSINIGLTVGGAGGRIVGSSKGGVLVYGNLPNGFTFYQNDGDNGPSEIANISISNISTWIASGGMMVNNSSMVCNSVNFGGMIACLLPYNIYDACFDNCAFGCPADLTTGYLGTLGLAGFAPHVHGTRTTNVMQAAIQLYGGNSSHICGNGIENCVVTCALGVRTGWGASCTISGNILTVSGQTGSGPGGGPDFTVGRCLFGRGLDMPRWGSNPIDNTGGVTIIDDHGTDPTLTGVGWGGTYRISASYTITTPIPIWTRIADTLSGCTVTDLQTEGAQYIVFLANTVAITINNAGGSAAGPECLNQFGALGYVQKAGLYIYSTGSCTVTGFSAAASCTAFGGIVFAPTAGTSGVSLLSCYTNQGATNTVTASIKNAGGTGAGDILNITAFTAGASVGIGMLVTGAGVTAGTRIIDNSASDPTLTGYNSTGTWRVDTVQNVSSEAMSVVCGPDWVMPTDQGAKTGIFIENYTSNTNLGSGVDSMAMHFSALPGQSDWRGYIPLWRGQEFFIVDGAKAGGGTAAVGDATQGSGTQNIKVGWNGTAWIRSW